MNLSAIKAYAQQARRDFIAAVKARAAIYRLTTDGAEQTNQRHVIGSRPATRREVEHRDRLARQMRQEGFDYVIEQVAYTWFNRFAALRYMELKGYLDHGYRVLSHPEGLRQPEILDHAADVSLPGLDRDEATQLKLDGARDEELYRLLLLAQCNALHRAMPFLFDSIGGETELLLPDNLLHSDSLIRKLIGGIAEGAWEEIEIVGWLYQFYISERKDQVIGKVVASEDIPAATQLFTPKWIVQYLVQNSLGAQWMATYPDSPLERTMDYYIAPTEQNEDVRARLRAITPASLDPEELTLMDPACGSGHVLVEAYTLFRAIYLERGYRREDVAQLILEKNLFGLDIDQRAAQLAGFAIMMKGREDDRRLFERDVRLRVLASVDSTDVATEEWDRETDGLTDGDMRAFKQLFVHASTYGSLIQVPERFKEMLPALRQSIGGSLVDQAALLARQYDVVVTNPPYMGSRAMNPLLKKFAERMYRDAKRDLFACFIERGYTLAKPNGHSAMVTMQGWMFLSSYEALRVRMLRKKTIRTMAHLGARAFGSISGEVVQTAAFVLINSVHNGYRPVFLRLLDGNESEKRNALTQGLHRYDATVQDAFHTIPGCPIVYWLSDRFCEVFRRGTPLGALVEARKGLDTGNNDRFLRRWHEVDSEKCGFGMKDREIALRSGKKWFPYNKGGAFRKWYGNLEYLINWEHDGRAIRAYGTENGERPRSRVQNTNCYFQEAVTWSEIGSSLAFRFIEQGAIHDSKGPSIFDATSIGRSLLAGYSNTPIVRTMYTSGEVHLALSLWRVGVLVLLP